MDKNSNKKCYSSSTYSPSKASCSNGISYSNEVHYSDGICTSNGVCVSDGICASDGVVYSSGVAGSYGVFDCQAMYRSVFCSKLKGKESFLLNKKSTPRRIEEIKENLNWYPVFNNVSELKGNGEWVDIDLEDVEKISKEKAWAKMPKEMLAYIRSLPEFDAEVFETITGIKTNVMTAEEAEKKYNIIIKK